jgi:uncharacterized membrane protein YagU involved in acid resistance
MIAYIVYRVLNNILSFTPKEYFILNVISLLLEIFGMLCWVALVISTFNQDFRTYMTSKNTQLSTLIKANPTADYTY